MKSYVVDDRGLAVPRSERGTRSVLLDGRYLWSFELPRDARRTTRGRRVDWPADLARRLRGAAVVSIEGESGVVHEERVSFSGDDSPLTLEDNLGNRLFINGAGHLTRSFADTDASSRGEVIEATRAALVDLREGGYDAHLSYGCLLGAVRDGQMIGHDSDADVAYVSHHTTPAQVIAESYRMERDLRRRGWKVIRMSGADLKLARRLPDGRKVYVDVFGGFHVGDTFYLLGGRSGTLPLTALTPPSTVTLEGVELPAPADPGAVLAFLYGPSWATPDPAFQNDDPPEGLYRLNGWLRGVRDEASEWNDFYRHRRDEVPRSPSDFARWVLKQTPADAPIADLASGTGRDGVWWVRKGRTVLPFEYVAAARDMTKRRLSRAAGHPVAARSLALNDRRSALVAGAELARTEVPATLVARDLVGCLNTEARDHLWVLAGMALRRGGALLLEFETGRRDTSALPELIRPVDVDVVVAEISARGGIVESVDVAPGKNFFDQPARQVARVVARWPRPTEAKENS